MHRLETSRKEFLKEQCVLISERQTQQRNAEPRSSQAAMKSNVRATRVNGIEIRRLRLARGWTQKMLARTSGYSERLIRKSENGGSLDHRTVNDLAIALSTPSEPIAVSQLLIDQLSITQQWVRGFNEYGREMLMHLRSLVASEFELRCPGEKNSAPFIGTFKGATGLQAWLDLYFSAFDRSPNSDVNYAVGVSDKFVIARWIESGLRGTTPVGPIPVNLIVRFKGELISQIEYDSDTLATHRTFSVA